MRCWKFHANGSGSLQDARATGGVCRADTPVQTSLTDSRCSPHIRSGATRAARQCGRPADDLPEILSPPNQCDLIQRPNVSREQQSRSTNGAVSISNRQHCLMVFDDLRTKCQRNHAPVHRQCVNHLIVIRRDEPRLIGGDEAALHPCSLARRTCLPKTLVAQGWRARDNDLPGPDMAKQTDASEVVP